MKITPIKNTNFGYNKVLNRELTCRLKDCKNEVESGTIKEINSVCNHIENRIVKLEGPNGRDISKNEDLIEKLSFYLLEIKTLLFEAVDELFPDLDFGKKESETYIKESEDIKTQTSENKSLYKKPAPAYIWREIIVDDFNYSQLEDDFEDEGYVQRKKTHIPDCDDCYYNDDYNCENLLEKFEPQKSSPKSLDDVVGLKNIIEDINDLIIYPINNPKEAAERENEYGIVVPHFIIMYGPPGCGKTMTAEAIKAQTGCEMYKLDISRAGSSFINESAMNITAAFDTIKEKAKKSEKPILVFMDEMESLLTKRGEAVGGDTENNKVVDALLQHVAKAQDNNIIILGATNMYDLIDPAIKDRAKLELYVGLPNNEERAELLRRMLSKYKMGAALSENKEELLKLANKLKMYSPRSIKTIAESAFKIAWKNNRELLADDILEAVEKEQKEPVKEEDYKSKTKKTAKMGFK